MKQLLILSILLSTIQLAFANSTIEIKAELSNAICNTNSTIVYIDLFVKKADNITQSVKLQNQNYRVKYNTSALELNSFFIESEGQLSSYGNNADQTFYLFAPHTLTGSTEHILSYNIDMQGGDGYELPNDWVLVGTVGATLKTNIECYSSQLLTESNFPSSVFIYTLAANDDLIIDKNPMTNDLSECVMDHCDNCYLNLSLNMIDDNYIQGEQLYHKVQDFISAENIIGSQSEVTFDVTNHALLNPGFEIQANALFEVKLDGCQ